MARPVRILYFSPGRTRTYGLIYDKPMADELGCIYDVAPTSGGVPQTFADFRIGLKAALETPHAVVYLSTHNSPLEPWSSGFRRTVQPELGWWLPSLTPCDDSAEADPGVPLTQTAQADVLVIGGCYGMAFPIRRAVQSWWGGAGRHVLVGANGRTCETRVAAEEDMGVLKAAIDTAASQSKTRPLSRVTDAVEQVVRGTKFQAIVN